MTATTTGSVAMKNNSAIVVCKRSFFFESVPAIFDAMKRAHGGRGTMLTAAVLIVCAIVAGTFFGDLPAMAQEVFSSPVPLTAEPSVSTRESSYISVVPFETVTYSDSELYEGETRVIVEGRSGLRRVTELHEYTNGQFSKATAVSSSLISESVNQVVAVGTRARPKTASNGKYTWPANGVVTSYFGRRSTSVGSSNHQGIDIAGELGDSVFAADGGEVVKADNKLKGYGLLIQLRHDNGDVTYYGHNSELLVEVGERVAQGEEIAKMGSTGISSGVHLHFEIRVDGTPVNPVTYLP